jgi:hypothetical protein
MNASGLSGRNSRLGSGARLDTKPTEQPPSAPAEVTPGTSPLPPPTHLAVENSESYWSPATAGNMGTNDWRKKAKYTTQF